MSKFSPDWLCSIHSHGEEALHHGHQAGHVGRLSHAPLLEHSFLDNMTLLEVHTLLEVFEHNLFNELLTVDVSLANMDLSASTAGGSDLEKFLL